MAFGRCSKRRGGTPSGEPPSVPPRKRGRFGGGKPRPYGAEVWTIAPAGVPLPFYLTGMIVMEAGATAGQV